MPRGLIDDAWKAAAQALLNEVGHIPDDTGRYCRADDKQWPCAVARTIVDNAREAARHVSGEDQN